MKNALIIGGSGFVGGYLCRELQQHGWQLTLTTTKDMPGTGDWNWVILDILDGEAVREVLARGGYDAVFHLAAQSSAAVSWKKPGLTVDVNVQGALNILEALRSMERPPRLLLVGSSEEYGPVKPEDCPLREEQPCHPANPYAVSKLCAEQLGLVYASAYELDIVCTRSFNHVGPGQGEGFVVSDFCRQIALLERRQGEKLMKVGNLSAKRDFSDVRDVVRAYRLLVERGRGGKVYNVGSGRAVSIRELLDGLLAFSACGIAVEVDEARLRPVDVPLHMADVSAIREDTGWTGEIPLEKTLLDSLNDWRQRTEGEV